MATAKTHISFIQICNHSVWDASTYELLNNNLVGFLLLLLLLLLILFWESKFSSLIVAVLRCVHQIIGSFQASLKGAITGTQTPTQMSLMKSDICFLTQAALSPLVPHDIPSSRGEWEMASSQEWILNQSANNPANNHGLEQTQRHRMTRGPTDPEIRPGHLDSRVYWPLGQDFTLKIWVTHRFKLTSHFMYCGKV